MVEAEENGRRLEDLYEDYRERRSGLGELQRRMQAVSATAVSARREVSVTVGYSGVVTDVSFPTGAYRRLAPKELADLLLRTMGEARDSAVVDAAAIMEPLMPAGMSASDLLRGDMDAMEMVPPEPRLPPSVLDHLRGGGV
jgi:hypothetical protein